MYRWYFLILKKKKKTKQTNSPNYQRCPFITFQFITTSQIQCNHISPLELNILLPFFLISHLGFFSYFFLLFTKHFPSTFRNCACFYDIKIFHTYYILFTFLLNMVVLNKSLFDLSQRTRNRHLVNK